MEKQNQKPKINILKFNFLMMITIIVWAFAFPLINIGLEELSFINLTIMRLFVVCTVSIFLILFQRKRFSKIHKKDILPIFLLGFFGVIVYHLGLNYGEQHISPGAASLIIATIPVFIVILAAIFLKEKITIKQLIGVIIALTGVVVISIWGKENIKLEIDYLVSAIAVLIAAIMGALYTIAGKKLLTRYNGLSLTLYAMLLGSLGLLPFVRVSLFEEVSNMSLQGWIAVLFLGIFSTVIGYVIWYIALSIKTASEISIYLYAIPVLSTIISFFMLGHTITWFFIIGGFLVISGLAIVNLRSKKQKS